MISSIFSWNLLFSSIFSVDDEKEIKMKKLADRRLLLKFAIQQNVAVSQPITGPEKKRDWI